MEDNTAQETMEKVIAALERHKAKARAVAFLFDRIAEGLAEYEHYLQCVRVLKWKRHTMGLTYFEHKRLEELT
jgi:hypothetical protein